jgi:hypothetical protein
MVESCTRPGRSKMHHHCHTLTCNLLALNISFNLTKLKVKPSELYLILGEEKCHLVEAIAKFHLSPEGGTRLQSSAHLEAFVKSRQCTAN